MTPLEQTTKNQRFAADPARSVFVMANAGSGKTRVLTNRVARLLLSETAPERILCITFTKAAAAEMADRLFSVLGEWALSDDAKLVQALAELEGEGAPAKTAADLARARRLFAKALETPGGLKIQTIHSFCESVLRRFPVEAGAPPGFQVVEDAQAAALLNDALDALAREARDDADIAADFARLALKRGESELRKLLTGAATGAQTSAQNAAGGLGDTLRALADALGVDPASTEAGAIKAFIGVLSVSDLRRAHDALSAEGADPQKAALRLAPFFSASDIQDKWAALTTFLLTDKGTPRKTIATKATDKIDPWVKPYVDDLKERFFAEAQTLKAVAIYHDSAALARLDAALRARYAAAKAARAALDFDDLILRARRLFANVEAAWVMYKLDYGVEHILIDEAQDTSPGQWAVVESLFTDYLSGEGARRERRSFFAVGDMKQSIYSFQGADAGLFKTKEIDLGERLAAVTQYQNVPLTLSFRTTEPVLAFVDAAFAEEAAAEGLGEFPMPAHGVCREGEEGLVELWPLTPRPEKPQVSPWDAPVDAPEAGHPVRVLCERIAGKIRGWLDRKEELPSRGRLLRAGDIMILVQSRGPLFNEIIRRLSTAGVPVAGPDRLSLTDDPAVEDLLSYARFTLTRSDDLSLAEVLKSPLFGFDDDDLFALAYSRAEGETLWGALVARAEEQPRWKRAAEEIAAARAVARAQGPYAFLSHVLGAGASSGRKRFYERLGEASADAIDELLRQAIDFENSHPRSVRGFIAAIETATGEIKREMERDHDCVRVMTVHGAKGLEADVVFLLDAHREPNLRNIGPLIEPPPRSNIPCGVRFLAWSKPEDSVITAAAREEKARLAYEEYRRLFYVAATRARDRLYVCGIVQGNNKDPQGKPVGVKSWHSLALDAFERLGERVETDAAPFWEGSPAPAMRISCKQTKTLKPKDHIAAVRDEVTTPRWLRGPAPSETPPSRPTPSKLIGEEEYEWQRPAEGAAYSPAGADRYFRGRTVHRLLELLPDVAEARRADAADKLLGRLAPGVDTTERARWRDEVLRVLADPQFAEVFAPGSMAETPIAGRPKGAPESLRVNGQIDRLAVSTTRVLVVDYKTNRPPPQDVRDADPAYIAQLASYRSLLQEIYPDHEIACALLWTYDARLMAVPSEMLDHAFARLKTAG